MTAAIRVMTSGIRPAEPAAGPTVAAGYAKALLDLAVSKGADREALLRRSGLRPDDLAHPDDRLAFARFKALMREAKTLCGEPALGLHFGEQAPLSKMSIVGLITHAAETMGQALAQTNRYGRLVIEVEGLRREDRFVIVRRGGEVWLEDRRKDPNDFPELTESTWARFVCEYRHFFPNRPPFVKAVHVTHPKPKHRAEYDRILQVPVTFDSDRNALLIDESWLSIRIGAPNRYVFGVLSEHANALLKSLENAQTTRGRVESLLIPILHTGELGMDAIARKMGLSRPTLYRRLKAEGVRYEDLLDELRHKMALHYMNGEKVSLSQTAYLVGFSDSSAFSRAFKRWTGGRPGGRTRQNS